MTCSLCSSSLLSSSCINANISITIRQIFISQFKTIVRRATSRLFSSKSRCDDMRHEHYLKLVQYVKYMLRATMSESTIECTKCSCESIRVSSYSYLQIGFLDDIYSIICSVLGQRRSPKDGRTVRTTKQRIITRFGYIT